jgi:hypothetical protein
MLAQSVKEIRKRAFEGQSPNSPSLRLALRVLRFASQRNCDLTLKPISKRAQHRQTVI